MCRHVLPHHSQLGHHLLHVKEPRSLAAEGLSFRPEFPVPGPGRASLHDCQLSVRTAALHLLAGAGTAEQAWLDMLTDLRQVTEVDL